MLKAANQAAASLSTTFRDFLSLNINFFYCSNFVAFRILDAAHKIPWIQCKRSLSLSVCFTASSRAC